MPRILKINEKNVILKNDAQRIAAEVYIDNTGDLYYWSLTRGVNFSETLRPPQWWYQANWEDIEKITAVTTEPLWKEFK